MILKKKLDSKPRKILKQQHFGKSNKNERNIAEETKSKLAKAYVEWESRKNAFEEKENEIEIKLNSQFDEEYKINKSNLKKAICGNYEYINTGIDKWLRSVSLPVEFSLQYHYDAQTGLLKVDLDLPEIEDLPTKKATQLKDGTVKRKQKTQKN